jgi:hypothetical protein
MLVLLALALPAAAQGAAGEPRIGLLDVRATQGATPAQAAQVRSALAASLAKFRIDRVDDHPAVKAAYGSGAEAAMAPNVEKARQRAKEGKKLFDDLDPTGAEAKFRQAADLFEQNAGGLSSPSDLINTYLSLARVFFATERETLARDIFKRVVQIQPDLILDKAVYPPGMVSVFEDVKKSLLSSPLGGLGVLTMPSPAKVYLDGRERGSAPLDLVNIPAGVHTLTVRRPGYAPWVRPVDITTFRVDKITAELVLDRHPLLDQVFVPNGADQKDPLGATLLDYLDAVAEAAQLDVLLVGRAYRKDKSLVIEVIPFRRKDRQLGPVESLVLTAAPKNETDEFASRILASLARAEWIPTIAARRTVEAGGGALDETATFGLRVSFVPSTRVGGNGKNFPNAPGAGFRIGADYRLAARAILSVETGYDALTENDIVLKDSAGNVAVSRGQNVQAIYTSIPLDVGARYYFGVSTLAPYATGALGVRWDQLSFREPLPFDEIKGSSGLGFAASLGGGVDYALGTRSALFGEARLQAGTVGASKASVNITTTPQNPDRKLPVDAGTYIGLRLYVGYARVF